MSSSSSTDESPDELIGDEVAGFRVDALIGLHDRVAVYAATQLDLERPVALKLIPADLLPAAGMRRLPWPDHPNAVALYAAGASEHGGFLAMQRMREPTLAAALRSGLQHDAARGALAGVAAVLDSLHREGRAHGSVHAGNVFMAGDRGLLTDFGLGPAGGTAAGDREAFAALVREVLGTPIPEPLPVTAAGILGGPGPPATPHRGWWPIAGAAAAVFAVLGVAALSFSSTGSAEKRPPRILPGAVALGSSLAASDVESVDCNGLPPTGSSEACTVVQTRLGDARLVPDRGGVIRRWAVQGARGELALQVLRRRGARYFLVARTPYARFADDGLHVIPANLPVRRGDLVGLEVTPGATIGVSNASDAETARWFGPIVLTVRPAEPHDPPLDRELLLGVEYTPGAKWRPPGELTGNAAATAPAGDLVARLRVDPIVRLELRETGDGVVVDLVKRGRRVVRAVVLDADPGGRVLLFQAASVRFGKLIIRVGWGNPDGEVTHDYVVDAKTIVPLS